MSLFFEGQPLFVSRDPPGGFDPHFKDHWLNTLFIC